jgi:hypothetical protein
MASPPFESLDFVYTPSEDVTHDMASFENMLGGRVVFAIDDGGTPWRPWNSPRMAHSCC